MEIDFDSHVLAYWKNSTELASKNYRVLSYESCKLQDRFDNTIRENERRFTKVNIEFSDLKRTIYNNNALIQDLQKSKDIDSTTIKNLEKELAACQESEQRLIAKVQKIENAPKKKTKWSDWMVNEEDVLDLDLDAKVQVLFGDATKMKGFAREFDWIKSNNDHETSIVLYRVRK